MGERERPWQGETSTDRESAKVVRDTGHTKEARYRDADEEHMRGRYNRDPEKRESPRELRWAGGPARGRARNPNDSWELGAKG